MFLSSEFSERACFPTFGQFVLRKTTFKFMWQFIFLLILKWSPQKTVGKVDFFWTWFNKSWPTLHKHQSDWVPLGKTWTSFGIKLHRGSTSYQRWIFSEHLGWKLWLVYEKKSGSFVVRPQKKVFWNCQMSSIFLVLSWILNLESFLEGTAFVGCAPVSFWWSFSCLESQPSFNLWLISKVFFSRKLIDEWKSSRPIWTKWWLDIQIINRNLSFCSFFLLAIHFGTQEFTC